MSSRRGPKPRFDRAEIVSVGLRLLDRHPDRDLTLAAIAEELGITAMALYGYFDSKADLLDSVVGAALRPAPAAPDPDAPWDEQLADAIRSVHADYVRRPALAQMIAAHSPAGAAADAYRNHIFALLRLAGLDDGQIIDAYGAINRYLSGSTIVEINPRRAPAAEEAARMRDLPASDFPELVRLADTYAQRASETSFEFGLSLLITGIRARTQRT